MIIQALYLTIDDYTDKMIDNTEPDDENERMVVRNLKNTLTTNV
jgi:hypothetical protein